MDRRLILSSLPRDGKKFWTEAAAKVTHSSSVDTVPEDPHWLAAIRACLLKHPDRFRLCLTVKRGRLSRQVTNTENLQAQLLALENGGRWRKLCGSFPTTPPNVYATIVERHNVPEDALHVCSDLYSASGVLLGVDSLHLMKIQRRDRLCKFMTSPRPFVKKVLRNLTAFSEWCLKQPWKLREKFIVFSGSVFTVMGLTWTTDIDVLVLHVEDFPFQGDKGYDTHVLRKDGTWIKNGSQVYHYQSQWLTTEWPSLAGASDIFEVVQNPAYHFFFMGVKFVSIELTLQRHLRRQFAVLLTDFIMMKKLLGIDLIDQVCLPSLEVAQGKVKTCKENTRLVAETVQKLARLWYGEDLSVKRVLRLVRKCPARKHCPNTGVPTADKDVAVVVEHNTRVGREVVGRHCGGPVLFVGYRFPEDTSDLVVREPWPLDKTYDCVVLPFTVGWYAEDLPRLCRYLRSVCTGRVLVLCLNARRLQRAFRRSRTRCLEVRTDQEPLFGVYALDPLPRYRSSWGRVVVYFNGTPGKDKGSVQNVVSTELLSSQLEGFRLVKRLSLATRSQPALEGQVSKCYHALLFVKQP